MYPCVCSVTLTSVEYIGIIFVSNIMIKMYQCTCDKKALNFLAVIHLHRTIIRLKDSLEMAALIVTDQPLCVTAGNRQRINMESQLKTPLLFPRTTFTC